MADTVVPITNARNLDQKWIDNGDGTYSPQVVTATGGGGSSNIEGTVLASAARTSAPTPVLLTNENGRALYIILDVTAVTATPSITVTIAGIDVVSGKAYTLLAGAAVTATGTVFYKVGPALPNTANVSANEYVPPTVRISVSHLDSDSITYSIGYALMMA